MGRTTTTTTKMEEEERKSYEDETSFDYWRQNDDSFSLNCVPSMEKNQHDRHLMLRCRMLWWIQSNWPQPGERMYQWAIKGKIESSHNI
jgi:hypothetical protein